MGTEVESQVDRSRGESARADGRLAPLVRVPGHLVHVLGVILVTRLRKCSWVGGVALGADRQVEHLGQMSAGDTLWREEEAGVYMGGDVWLEAQRSG